MKDDLGSNKLHLKRGPRWCVYILILLSSMFSALDGTIFNTAITWVKEDLKFTNEDYGLFSSMLFVGKIVGAFGFIFLLNLINRKYLFVLSMLMSGGGMIVYTMCSVKYILYTVRSILGFFNVFFIIYSPVWIDQYGIRKYKTLMITSIQITIPIGGIIGSVMGTYLHWRVALRVTACFLVIEGLALFCINSDYFSNKIYSSMSPSQAKDYTVPSIYEIMEKKEETKEKKDENNNHSIFGLLKNKTFLVYAFSRSFLLFPLIASSTFINDYFQNVLGVNDKSVRLGVLTALSLSGTLLGSIIGGIIGTLIGGYQNKRASIALIFLQIISAVSSIIVPYMNTLFTFAILFGINMTFISAIMPIITGMVITSVPNEQRAMANSLTSLIVNLFGMMPGPYIYGKLNTLYDDKDPRFPMKVVHYVSLVCLALFIVGALLKYGEKQIFNEEKEEGTALKDIKENENNKV